MNKVDFGIRFLMAVLFILFGASKFYAFMPTPQISPEAANFLGALVSTGYLWYLVGVIEIIGGVALLYNRTANLGILMLGPIIVNILGYLLILQHGIGAPPIIMSVFLFSGISFLIYRRKEAWLKLLKAGAERI